MITQGDGAVPARTALICGVSGQDGGYLARLLLAKGYRVAGTSRDAQVTSFANLRTLGIFDRVEVHSMVLTDFRSVLQALHRVQPDEIYNLAGQSSVGLSFQQPAETLLSITLGSINLMEAVQFLKKPARIYIAGSGEVFGHTGDDAASEDTPFRPVSPYATAKAAATWAAANYRSAYGQYVCTGLLFNHESPLRPQRFVTRKIVAAACRIAQGSGERLVLGDTKVRRDWGWAPEYMEAIYRMLQQDVPEDFVIATGRQNSLMDFCALVFAELGLNVDDHMDHDASLTRPLEIAANRGDPSKAERKLGWRAQLQLHDIVRRMVAHERAPGPESVG
jgi:GDPmannose 4,6-dehydratase